MRSATVQRLMRDVRGPFLAGMEHARKEGKLDFAGSTAELADPIRWAALRDGLYRKGWKVYAKPPFGGPEQVLRYLGGYTHRVAISNHRLVSMQDGKVTFTYKDYKDRSRTKSMTLDAIEFLRRFLLHVLPQGFVRIRHYGLWAARNVNTKLAVAKQLLASEKVDAQAPTTTELESYRSVSNALQHPLRTMARHPQATPQHEALHHSNTVALDGSPLHARHPLHQGPEGHSFPIANSRISAKGSFNKRLLSMRNRAKARCDAHQPLCVSGKFQWRRKTQ